MIQLHDAQANRGDADRCHAGDESVRDRCLGGIVPYAATASNGSAGGSFWNYDLRTGNPTGPAGQLDSLELRPGHRCQDRRLLTWSRAGGPRDALERRTVSVVGSIRAVPCGRQRQAIGGRMMLLNRASWVGVVAALALVAGVSGAAAPGTATASPTFVAGNLSHQGRLRLTSTGVTCRRKRRRARSSVAHAPVPDPSQDSAAFPRPTSGPMGLGRRPVPQPS